MIPLSIFFWLIYKDLVVSGRLNASYDFENRSPFITVLRPQSRVSDIMTTKDGDYFQNIKQEPIYFDVRLPRKFQKAEVKIKYKNFDQTIFEIGAMTDRERWNFDLKPIENKAINFLLQDKFHWSHIEEGDTLLFQKNKKYEKIDDFIEKLPPLETLAVYNYNIEKDFFLPKYSKKEGGVEINKTLRGSHRFYTYIKDEPLDITLLLQDVNRHSGDDYVGIDVYYHDQGVYRDFFKIDTNSSDDRKMSETKEVKIYLPDFREGAYRVEITTPSDDIFIRKISTQQDYIAFINKIYLGDNVGYTDEHFDEKISSTKIYTNGKIIGAITSHIEGLQDLVISKKVYTVSETHKKYYFDTSFGMKEMLVPRNDIIIETRGLLSFSSGQFFNPEITTLSDGTGVNFEDIDYVITQYSQGKELEDGWRENSVIFDVSKYDTEDDEIHFTLSLPYIQQDDEGIAISEIAVTLIDDPMTPKLLLEKIKDYVRR